MLIMVQEMETEIQKIVLDMGLQIIIITYMAIMDIPTRVTWV